MCMHASWLGWRTPPTQIQGNMGYDGIEGPIVEPTPGNAAYGMGGKVVGFNIWHGSDPSKPRGWDKNGADRRFKTDMAVRLCVVCGEHAH